MGKTATMEKADKTLMTKWEYTVEENHSPINLIGTSSREMLEQAGRNGWELTSVDWKAGLFVFKRPIKEKLAEFPGLDSLVSTGYRKAQEGSPCEPPGSNLATNPRFIE